jgi:exodeoxyribonuclease-3
LLFFRPISLVPAGRLRQAQIMLRIATWNINSVRLRLGQVARYVETTTPDVLALQEIKCREGEFPRAGFAAMGFKHLAIVGQKGWHGVAIASRHPIEQVEAPDLCPRSEARVVAVRVAGVELHNLYIPAGGDEPDVDLNAKFAHKLQVLERMRQTYAARAGDGARIVVGDLNVAPLEHDVWNHRQLLGVVSHTPVETEALEAARVVAGLVDLPRQHHPEPEKLFTWWSYRNRDWRTSNRGRRLDHIWVSPDLAACSRGIEVHVQTRDWSQPSDHVPLSVDLAL